MGGNQSQTEESNNSLQMLQLMEQVIFGLNLNNINESIESYLSYFDEKYSYSFTLITCNLLYSYFLSQDNVEAFFVFLKELKTKEKINLQFIQILLNISKKQESNYLIEKMIENEIIDPTICENISNKNKSDQFSNNFISDELSQNDYELHKKLIKEGHNPNEITKIIRNDEIGKLQEISSHSYFDFDQKIEPSLYEKHSFVNKENVSLIDYAAFFGSVKCFKYLLMNGADIYNTGKFAIAGGNEEIIHLCEQNHSSFYKTYETAIKFHNNDIFKYLYENKLEEINGLTELGIICILYNNYEIFSFLIQEGLNTNVSIMNTAIETGNLFITMYLLEKKPISIDLCKIKSFFGNKELFDYLFDNMFLKVSKTDLANACKNGYIDVVKILLERKEFDINIKDEYGDTPLLLAMKNDKVEIAKLLIKQEKININCKNNYGWTALIFSSVKNFPEITKLLLEKRGIDINAKDIYLFCLKFSLMIWNFIFIFGDYLSYKQQLLCMHLHITMLK